MAQLNGSGGGGGSDGSTSDSDISGIFGDPAGDTDQTTDDAAGGLDGPDTQNEIEDDSDSTRTRRLRRDARSDPMNDPTEPEPETTSTSRFGQELGGDPAGDADRTTDDPQPDSDPMPDSDGGDSGPDPSDADRFGQELGGDPAGDADRTTDTGPSPTDAGGFGQELGGDPAGDADRTPGPTPDDVAGPGRSDPQQGIEESGATENVEQQAQEFEQQVLAENPWLSEEDVAIQLVGTDEGARFQVELTEGAEERASARQQDVFEGLGIGAGSLAATGGTDRAADAQAERRAEFNDVLEGLGIPDVVARSEAAADERQTASARLSGAMSASSAIGSQSETQALDKAVEGGENFLASLGVTLPEFTRESTPGPRAGPAEQTGTTRIELGDLIDGPVTLPTFGERPVTPGRGTAPRERTGEREILTGDIYGEPATEDFGDAIGGLELAVYGEREVVPGPRAGERERVGTVTVDEALRQASEDLTFEFETLPAGEREIVPGPGTAPRERVPVEDAPEQHQDLSRAVEGAMSAPAFVPGTAGLLVNVGDFGIAVGDALTPEFGERETVPGPRAGGRRQVEGPDYGRAGDLLGGAGQTVGNVAAFGASRAIEDPVETGAFAVGTLGASALLFGGAAAIGSRTSLATRAVIQPGEELAGIAGYNLARPALGASRAGRLFPGRGRLNREPLFLSEESAIRGARRAHSRASDLLEGRLPDIGGNVRRMSRNLETDFTELRTQARIEDTPPRPSAPEFGRPRALVEGPVAASGPRAIGRGDLGEGEFVVRPRRTGETELEADDPAGPLDTGDLEGTGDGGGTVGGGPLEFEVEHRTDSGVVVERVRADRPRPAESDLTRDLRGELEGGRRRLESSIGFGMDTVEGPTLDAGPFAGDLAAPSDLVGDIAGAELEAPAELDIGRTDLELGQELFLELEQEFEFEGRTQLDLEFEQEQEQESELFAELEGRSELEVEGFGLRRRRDDRARDSAFAGDRRLIRRSLLNPLTGR